MTRLILNRLAANGIKFADSGNLKKSLRRNNSESQPFLWGGYSERGLLNANPYALSGTGREALLLNAVVLVGRIYLCLTDSTLAGLQNRMHALYVQILIGVSRDRFNVYKNTVLPWGPGGCV